MRLELRRLAGPGAFVPLLVVSVSCCIPHAPLGDVVSGAPRGSALVKVLVTLSDDKDQLCVADVQPSPVIVLRGSAIRWLVDNRCSKPGASYLQFTTPVPYPVKKKDDEPTPKAWDYRFCTGRTATLSAGKDDRNVLFCEVPETVVPGLYKYGLDGAAKKDPDIEVRKGGK